MLCICDKACCINTIQCTDGNARCMELGSAMQVQLSAFDHGNIPFKCPCCLGHQNDRMYDWSLLLHKLNTSKKTSIHLQQQVLKTYNATQAEMMSTDAKKHGAEGAALIQGMSPRVRLMGAIKLHL